MSLPDSIQNLINKYLESVRSNSKHLLLPVQRQDIYDSFVELSPTNSKTIRQWLEILTVKNILPLWKNWDIDWSNYPNPEKLVLIKEERLLGKIKEYTKNELLSEEMSSLTGETWDSPLYPIWCVFEAAVAIDFYSKRTPTSGLSDEDWKTSYDVAKLALIAYAGRIETELEIPKKVREFWDWWHREEYWKENTPLPWKQCLDSEACLTFWTWWLTEAIPQAWEKANSLF